MRHAMGDTEAINSPIMNAIQRALNNDSQELNGFEQIMVYLLVSIMHQRQRYLSFRYRL